MRIVARDTRHTASAQSFPEVLAEPNSSLVDDTEDTAGESDFCWCAETSRNRVLREIAFAPEGRPAIAASEKIFGSYGAYIIAVMIMISTFGCNNGLILSGARVYYTMAKDGLFFKPAGELNKFAVPQWGLWVQCVLASILCLSGKYGDLLNMVSFVVVIFYVLTIIGIFILRKKRPDAERPYKAFGYPVLPVIYIILGITFCLLLIKYKPDYTWPGLIIVLIGVPLYFIAIAVRKK